MNNYVCDQRWKTVTLLCVPGVSCGRPHPLENGVIEGTGYNAGNSVVYQCNIGFYLLGDAKVHCTNSGKWGGNQPSCLGRSWCD